MGNEFSTVSNENKRWLKCVLAVNVHARDALLEVLHDPKLGGITSDPKQLYNFFQQKKQQRIINKLIKKVLNQDQVALLLPQNQQTFSSKWDITLICVVIANFSNLPPPTNGWFQPLDLTDVSVSASVVIVRQELRNPLNHGSAKQFNDLSVFEPFWKQIEKVLINFQYSELNKFNDLGADSVDPATFPPHIDSFIKEINKDAEKDKIIKEALKWLVIYNQKSKYDSIKKKFKGYYIPVFLYVKRQERF